MDLTEDVEPVTQLKRNAAGLIERARERATPIVITQNGKPTAVLQDVDSFERQRRALLLLKLMGEGERDFEEGRTLTDRQARKRLRAGLAETK